jgi:hypothetical protein
MAPEPPTLITPALTSAPLTVIVPEPLRVPPDWIWRSPED